MSWDPALYQSAHAFVYESVGSLIKLLSPQSGEQIIDLGCGTGQLTAEIAASGAQVTGLDSSEEMIHQARRNYPAVDFIVADGRKFELDVPVDAIFSNAALHWIKPPFDVVQRMRAALKPGGRLVAEFGGKGNIATILQSARTAAQAIDAGDVGLLNINYFPSVSEYAALLEANGFEVRLATLFDRSTPLEGAWGLRRWLEMFRADFLHSIPESRKPEFYMAFENAARRLLYHDTHWTADYRRLRVEAFAV